MNEFDEFEKQIEKQAKRFGIVTVGAIIFNMILSLGFLGGIGWLVYVLLKHFGIVG